jgi:hypothetical protein
MVDSKRSGEARPAGETPNGAARLHQAVDALIERFGAPPHVEEISLARSEYQARRGRVFEEEELWESWTQAFLEWYVVERVPAGERLPLAARALAEERDPRQRQALAALGTSHRSLVEVRELAPGVVKVVDLLGGAAFAVNEQRALHGVSEGDVMEVRLIGYAGQVWFGRTFWYHPSGTRAAILRHAEAIGARGGHRSEILDFCANLRIRCDRYRHVDARRIYDVEPGVWQEGDSGPPQRRPRRRAPASVEAEPGS